MSSALIDPILKRWVEAQNLVLMQDCRWGGSRFFHQSSDVGECFQVVVTAEQDGMVRIDAHLIESLDDTKADFTRFTWRVPVLEFERALELCALSYRNWFKGREGSQRLIGGAAPRSKA